MKKPFLSIQPYKNQRLSILVLLCILLMGSGPEVVRAGYQILDPLLLHPSTKKWSTGFSSGLESSFSGDLDSFVSVIFPHLTLQDKGFIVRIGDSLGYDLSSTEWQTGTLDNWKDYPRFVRTLGYDTRSLRIIAGTIDSLTLNQGTIVREYGNNLLRERHRPGFHLLYDWEKTVTGEAFVSNVLEWSFFGLAIRSRPLLSTTSTPTQIQRLLIGLDAGFDLLAPYGLTPGYHDKVLYDKNSDSPLADTIDRQIIVGGTIEIPVYDTPPHEVIVYSALNGTVDRGFGAHIGSRISLTFTGDTDHRVEISLDGHRRSGDYISGYFGSFYDILRYDAQLGTNIPLRQLIASETLDRSGYFASVGYALRKRGALRFAIDDQGFPGGQGLMVSSSLEIGQKLTLTALYGSPPTVSPSLEHSFSHFTGRWLLNERIYFDLTMFNRWGMAIDDPNVRYRRFYGVFAGIGLIVH